VLSRDAGWKEGVKLEGGKVRVIARFDGWWGKYASRCHGRERESTMTANVEVVR
jgi:hypothetical protein